MKGKNTKKILLVAIAILLSITALGTSTLAWFSMNTRVTVNQVTLNTTAPSNMLIKSNINDNWNSFSTATTDVEGGFAPASSTDGKTFFALNGYIRRKRRVVRRRGDRGSPRHYCRTDLG